MSRLLTHSDRKRHAVRARTIAGVIILAGFAGPMLVLNSAGAANDHAVKKVVITTIHSAKLGTYLVSGSQTIYTLNKKNCDATCLKYWPAVVLPAGASKAGAGFGVSSSKLSKIKDAKGTWQVTYGGKALYTYVNDKGAGQVKGNNVKDAWGLWNIIVTVKPASGGASATTTTAPGTGGVGF